MYRGNTTSRICIDCGKSFEQQEGTLAMKSESYNRCPYCNGKSKIDLEEMEKRKNKRKERQKKFEKLASRLGVELI